MAQKKVRVAIIGTGNCASFPVQGVQFYQDIADDAHVPGIMHTRLSGYHIRDSDYVRWLSDRKWAYIRMEGTTGTTFGNVPLNVEVKLKVWDSPNSAGVMIDAAKKWKRLSKENVMSDVYCVIRRTQYETRNLKSL